MHVPFKTQTRNTSKIFIKESSTVGSYSSIEDRLTIAGKIQSNSKNIKSTFGKRYELKKLQTPGPSQYKPNQVAKPKTTCVPIGNAKKKPLYSDDGEPGPGSYHPKKVLVSS